MGLFDKHDDEPVTGAFMGLVLDSEALSTPVGVMRLAEITRAEFVRDIVADGDEPDETSAPAVVGGAAIGGAAFGVAGAVVGGLVSSTYKEEGAEHLKTLSVHLDFTTNTLSYSLPIPRDQESGAAEFADTVKRAMKQRQG